MSSLRCDFCYRRCLIPPGGRGFCGARTNHNGQLEAVAPNRCVSLAVDPIEKKPFYHVRPGSGILSVALPGCNFRCRFCQNHEISQPESWNGRAGPLLAPTRLAAMLREQSLSAVAFTYSEPGVWQDWARDAAMAVCADGALCAFITNGSQTPESLERLLPWIRAWNVDLKGSEAFYRDWCSAEAEPVWTTIARLAHEPGLALEICTLLIEGVHSTGEILAIGERLGRLGVQVWHLSRFFPAWKASDRAPTSESFLASALEAVRRQGAVPFIYPGNSRLSADTRCPSCGTLLVARPDGRKGQLEPGIQAAADGRAACPGCRTAFPLLV